MDELLDLIPEPMRSDLLEVAEGDPDFAKEKALEYLVADEVEREDIMAFHSSNGIDAMRAAHMKSEQHVGGMTIKIKAPHGIAPPSDLDAEALALRNLCANPGLLTDSKLRKKHFYRLDAGLLLANLRMASASGNIIGDADGAYFNDVMLLDPAFGVHEGLERSIILHYDLREVMSAAIEGMEAIVLAADSKDLVRVAEAYDEFIERMNCTRFK